MFAWLLFVCYFSGLCFGWILAGTWLFGLYGVLYVCLIAGLISWVNSVGDFYLFFNVELFGIIYLFCVWLFVNCCVFIVYCLAVLLLLFIDVLMLFVVVLLACVVFGLLICLFCVIVFCLNFWFGLCLIAL